MSTRNEKSKDANLIERPKSNWAQIISAVSAVAVILFGQNLCSRVDSKVHLSTSENTKQLSDSLLFHSKNKLDTISIGLSRASKTISSLNKITTDLKILAAYELANKGKFTEALDSLDSILLINRDSIATRNLIVNAKNAIIFMQETGFQYVDWHGDLSLVHVIANNKSGVYDTNKKLVITPQYDEVRFVNRNLIAVQKNEKWGFINRTGELILPYQFTDLFDVYLPFTVTFDDEKIGLINYRGRTICSPEYDDLTMIKSGLIVLKNKGKYGIKDSIGQVVLKMDYDFIEKDTSKTYISVVKGSDSYHFNTSKRNLVKL